MADKDKGGQKRPLNNGENEPKKGMAGWLWIVILVSIPLLLIYQQDKSEVKDSIQESKFYELLETDKIKEVVVHYDKGLSHAVDFNITLKQDGKTVTDENKTRTVNILIPEPALEALRAHKIPYGNKKKSAVFSEIISFILPLIIIVALFYFLFARQLKNAGRGAMQFGKSKAKMFSPSSEQVTFADVAGVSEAREEVEEIVDFLKDPAKYRNLGGRLPKGCLMVGPPGTGKTLLARAIAGEAGVPFFSMSGSDFVEMFVGVGASRVRDLFEQAKKHQPCILFIDEIDAVGRARNSGGTGGGNDEREQTLNALLVEMDGFENQNGVILIAATNRADVLDKALLRPGRFDRRINVDVPDLGGRLEILKVHAKKVKLGKNVNLKLIARGTPGYSGADLANVINEGALIAARLGKKAIEHADMEEARDKVRWGKERRSMKMSQRELRLTAYHEAGHTLVSLYAGSMNKLHKVTIMPRGNAYLGATMYFPEDNRYTTTRTELLAEIATTMGGQVAEKLTFGDITNGASGDIQQATNLARRMVRDWGMGEMGFIHYSSGDGEYSMKNDYSEEVAKKLDIEVRSIIDTQYEVATKILTEYQDQLKLLSETLLERETMSANEVYELLDLQDMMEADEDEFDKKLEQSLSTDTSAEDSEDEKETSPEDSEDETPDENTADKKSEEEPELQADDDKPTKQDPSSNS
ncbi:ATP-dependent zinc metalloprotease FtsH [Lentisphaera profundi]|uniref:ATP-dependent zinc metalloprotease FtsH n=1 Tax=Lentisphaera profundi TaxID=1658616 RepID=A0ABY7VUL2_9BACT|nr:ATP-dependent zinc metalloprotease FtsH [Lentisphaera profundi]WDE96582.1 ATP-dependent zinc metalloprotease FtsH [Lentisphaera profundi]